MAIEIPDHIRNLQPYRAGKAIETLAREKGLTQIVKLASNENPLGASPKAVAAIQEFSAGINRYPDPQGFSLVEALAKKYRLEPECIVCGHGSDSLLAYAINAFTCEGEEVLTSEGTFVGVYVSAKKQGRKVRKIPLRNYHYDLRQMCRSIKETTRIVYLANPNNPTGSMFSRAAFEAFMDKVPKDVLVILDEAYALYASENTNYPNGLDYCYDNLIVMRTFSKDYGLAGLRVGFAYGPEELIAQLAKVKLPFEPNLLAQVAAIAALEDDVFLKKTQAVNTSSLKRLRKKLDQFEISYVESVTNFLMLVFPSEALAEAFTNQCQNRGLIVRHVKAFGIPQGVRINSGNVEETTFALGVLNEIFSQQQVDRTLEPRIERFFNSSL